MVTVACCLWEPNDKSETFSRCYSESWVDKLHRGFARNLTDPIKMVCFTDRARKFETDVEQRPLTRLPPSYGNLIEPFSIDEPAIICGLDMIVVDNVDHLADYCLNADRLAMPEDPYCHGRSINPIVLKPRGHTDVFSTWHGENDMEHLRKVKEWTCIDDLWPGEVLSLKFHDVRRKGLQGSSIIYMHGNPKPHELLHLDWVNEHWK